MPLLYKQFIVLILISFINIPVLNADISNRIAINNSDIFVMYNPNNIKKVRQYHIDGVTWGSQINYTKKDLSLAKNLLVRNERFGIWFNSVDIALIQEGGKYVICGDVWDAKCDQQYWLLRKNDELLSKLITVDNSIIKRAVIDGGNNVVGIPWLVESGKIVPMANVNDPDYKIWILNKVDLALSLKPDIIHFDEVYMEVTNLTKRKTFTIASFEYDSFVEFMRAKSYLNMKLKNNVIDFKKNPDLWSAFISFKYESARLFLYEVINHIKQKSNNDVLVSGNFSPSSWFGIHVSSYFDFIASEVPHKANTKQTSFVPLYVYKMANGLNKTIISTAQGGDWKTIKEGNHTNLVSSWIAQAYTLDQYMNFPLKTWMPGSSYNPNTNEYSNIASWIKDNSELFDDYKLINTVALVMSPELLLNYKKREEFKLYIEKMIGNGVLFRVVFDDNNLTPEQFDESLSAFSSVLLPFEEYLDDSKKVIVSNNSRRVYKGVLSTFEIQENIGLSSMQFTSGENIYAFLKKNVINNKKYSIHLLNRNYNSVDNKMDPYSNVVLKIDHSVIGSANIKSVVINILNSNSIDELRSKIDITYSIDEGYLYLKIPFISLWNVVEIELQ